MRITDPARASGPGRARRAAAPAGGASFAGHIPSETASGAAGVSGAAPLSAVLPILPADPVDDPGGRRSSGLDHADRLLDGLERVQRQLVLGTLTRSGLMQLQDELDDRSHVADPKLAAILADVELRVAVELAKYGG